MRLIFYAKVISAYYLIGCFCFNAIAQNQFLADSLIDIIKNSQVTNDSVLFQLNKTIAFNSNNAEENIKYAKRALIIAERNQNNKWIAISYGYLGYGYRLKGNLIESAQNYLNAISYRILIQDSLGLAVQYSNLAVVYGAQENYSYSDKYYKKSISLLREIKDSIRLASALLNHGELHRQYENYDSALLLFEESELIFKKTNYEIGTAYSIGNIGLVYLEQNKHDLSELNIKKAISVLKRLGDRFPIAAYEIALSEIFQKQGNVDLAMEFASSALKISLEEDLKEQIRDASLKLSELYEINGDYKNAFLYQEQYLTYRDSINNEDVIRKMADLRTEFEVGQKQIEVDLLNQQAKTQRIILGGVLVVLILVFVLAYVLYKLYKLRDRAIKISKRRREVITAQRNELELLNNTKDKFFSIISHDIRAPVNNFQGVSQLINLYVESGDTQELVRIAKLMDKSSEELSSLLDNLLDWAMNQQGKFPYKPEQIRLAEICSSNLRMMENLADAKEIKLISELEEISLVADRNSVSTIIRNLLSNAIKFTNHGGEVKLTLDTIGPNAVIEISDTGVGIPQDKLYNLFGFKGERSRWGTAGEKGVGLGLNLVHEFVQMNHGDVEVDSEEGVGTTFTVTLPLG